MSVRMRINRSATGKRRSHQKAEMPQLASCADCGASHVRHRVCPGCGRYRGRVVIDVAAQALKREEKRKAKAAAIAADRGEMPQEEAKLAAQEEEKEEDKEKNN